MPILIKCLGSGGDCQEGGKACRWPAFERDNNGASTNMYDSFSEGGETSSIRILCRNQMRLPLGR